MFEIPKEKVFKLAKVAASEEDNTKIVAYFKNDCDELLLVELDEILKRTRELAPDLYMKGVTREMIIYHT